MLVSGIELGPFLAQVSDMLQEARKTTPALSLDELVAMARQAGIRGKGAERECVNMLRYFDQLGDHIFDEALVCLKWELAISS